jgi:MFS transporter, DHA2 family, multidrug resistance protein
MATLVSFVMLGLLFVVPQYLQEVLGASTLGTGLRLLPVIGGLILGALLGNWMQGDRPGARFRADTRFVVAIGFALLAAGGLIGLGTTTASGTGFAVAWLLIGGVGLGMALPAAMNTAIGAVPQEHSGAGASVIWVFRQVGGTFGVAVLGTILSSTYRAHLHVPGLPPAVSSLMRESVTAGVAAAHRIPLPGLLSAVHSAFVDAMDQVLVVCAAIAVVSAVLALAMRLPRGAAVGEMRSGTLATASEEDAA